MPDKFTKVANCNDIKPGEMLQVNVNGHGILIANVDGRYYAADDMCTHEDASLSTGCLQGEFVKCPLHGSRFNIVTGQAMEDPAEEDLKTYPVKIENEDILIRI
jgi:3-phenylpropionate/trans-cinnamate dioxygenase ferredoxin subunit